MVGGDQEVSRFHDPFLDQDYDVQLRLSEADRNDPRTIERLYVARSSSASATSLGAGPQVGMAPGGGLVRLDNLVKIAPASTASRIDRSERQRENRLRGVIAPGYGQADRIDALRAATAELNLPAGYTTVVSGRAREFEKTFVEFLWVFLLAVIFMYMILASQFESLVHPFTILLSLPLAVPFALFSLWYTGNTLNLYSALGILVLFGVVKKNAILQIDHMNALRQAGHDRADGDPPRQPQPAAADPDDDARAGRRHAAALARDRPGRGGAAGHRGGGHRRADALAAADAAGDPRGLLLFDDLARVLRGRRRAAPAGAHGQPAGAGAPGITLGAQATGARNGAPQAGEPAPALGDRGPSPAAPRELEAHSP